MNKKIVVGMGEALWDCLPQGKQIGGAPANFAYHASQLDCEGYVVSAIGNDDLGNEIQSVFDSRNLKSILQRVDYPTGTVQVTLDGNGIPSYVIEQNVAWDNIPESAELDKLAEKTDCLCFGSLAQRNTRSRETIRRFISLMPAGSIKVFDINLRQNFYSKDVIEVSLKLCNVLKINDEEIVTVSKMFNIEGTLSECGRRLLDMFNLKAVILTCGEKGSYTITRDITSFVETPKVTVADTVGAGDSFTATFCSSILNGADIESAHRKAVNVSAFVCTQAGAMPALPDHLK